VKLTELQQALITQSAAADGRSEAQMLGFLLAEGLRFYWSEKHSNWGPPFNADIAANELEHQALQCVKQDIQEVEA
tara:strand:- start:7578 stop:7805 length:228 start_codon:yes stop_codon:yes gene_type:complete